MTARLLALVGGACLLAGVVLAASLTWSAWAGLSAGLVFVGGGCLYAGLLFDFDRRE